MRFIKLMLLPTTILCSLAGCATREYVDESIARLEARDNEQEQALTELSTTSRQALERADDAGVLAQGKFLYDVVLVDDEVTFDSGATSLSDTNQQRLRGLAEQLKADNQSVYLEIQGFTDATGAAEFNDRLGLQRAESVRRFLHLQGVALDRMATISYGEDSPLASNDTPDGRAANRRVAVVVLN
jgi:peptidoglycan-associated lipoprotein